MATYRYFATRQLRRGLDDAGEPLFYALGEEIAVTQFGSPGALHAAISRGHVVAVPVVVPGADGEAAIATMPRPRRGD